MPQYQYIIIFTPQKNFQKQKSQSDNRKIKETTSYNAASLRYFPSFLYVNAGVLPLSGGHHPATGVPQPAARQYFL